MDLDHDGVSGVEELLCFDREVRPAGQQVTRVGRDLLRSEVDPRVRELRAEDEKHVRVVQLGSGAEVAAAPVVEDAPHDLDPLPRHRLCSIP
jgi:hypothetical protein